jgi:hypothetical protein
MLWRKAWICRNGKMVVVAVETKRAAPLSFHPAGFEIGIVEGCGVVI